MARRLVAHCGDIDVRMIAGNSRPDQTGEMTWAQRRLLAPRGYALAIGFVVAAGLTAKLLQRTLALEDHSLVFLTAVLFSAIAGGLGPSILAAFLSLLAYDLFFVEPLYTLRVTHPQDLLSLGVFLVVAVLTSHLMSRIREQAETARRREERTAALYAFSRELAAAVSLHDLASTIVRHVHQHVGGPAALYLPTGEGLSARAIHPPESPLGEAERAVAIWTFEHQQAAGKGCDTFAASPWAFFPLSSARGPIGSLAVRSPDAPAPSWSQRQLLETMARLAGVAIERARIDVVLEEKAKTEAILEASEDGIIVLDSEGTVVQVNEVACAILEVGRQQAIGRRFEALGAAHPHYLRLRAALRDFQAQPDREPERVEIALFLRGRDHYFLLRPTPFTWREGQPNGWVLALQDVTYLRDQEAKREALIAMLSHEMGTPLTSLSMAQELLWRQESRLSSQDRELLETIREDVARLRDLGTRLLDVSRTRAMTIALERGPVDLDALGQRVAKIFAPQAREKGIRLETAHGADLGSIVADATKLTWALSNLVANALRYTPSGGLVRLTIQNLDDGVTIVVSDTGPGIPAPDASRIFERWVQVEGPGTAGASGLGLAIVRDIVQAHDGRIRFEPNTPHGSRFVLHLPRG